MMTRTKSNFTINSFGAAIIEIIRILLTIKLKLSYHSSASITDTVVVFFNIIHLDSIPVHGIF